MPDNPSTSTVGNDRTTTVEDKPALPGQQQVLKLVTLGRKTGLPHIVLLRFVSDSESFYVLPGHGGADWSRNALVQRTVKVRMGEYVYEATIEKIRGPEAQAIRSVFQEKYGRRIMNEWYRESEGAFKLTPSAPPRLRAEQRGELEARTSFEDWKGQNSDYYRGISEAFDSASEEYDYTINRNYINRWIRKRSISEVVSLINPTDLLLEIGCGTGAEAIELSRFVHRIIATDISPRMVEILTRKVAARGKQGKIVPLLLPASRISSVRDVAGSKVNLAYSFNGALNCEPAVGSLSAELSKVIESNGYFVCSIRNTICISEMLSHLLVLQFDRTNPRKQQPIMISVGGMDIPAVYYSPGRFAKLFSNDFRLRRIIGLPAILPPAYLSDYYLRLGVGRLVAERIERALSDRLPFNRLGDQTLFVFQKR